MSTTRGGRQRSAPDRGSCRGEAARPSPGRRNCLGGCRSGKGRPGRQRSRRSSPKQAGRDDERSEEGTHGRVGAGMRPGRSSQLGAKYNIAAIDGARPPLPGARGAPACCGAHRNGLASTSREVPGPNGRPKRPSQAPAARSPASPTSSRPMSDNSQEPEKHRPEGDLPRLKILDLFQARAAPPDRGGCLPHVDERRHGHRQPRSIAY